MFKDKLPWLDEGTGIVITEGIGGAITTEGTGIA